MTPKEKAIELVNSYQDLVMTDYKYDEMPLFDYQKKCALIVVNELLNYINRINAKRPNTLQDKDWFEVKQEIEKL